MTTGPETTATDPLAQIAAMRERHERWSLDSEPGDSFTDFAARVEQSAADVPPLLDMADALLKLAGEFDRPASDLRDPNPVAAMEAMAFMHAAARIRSAIAAALAPAAEEPCPCSPSGEHPDGSPAPFADLIREQSP